MKSKKLFFLLSILLSMVGTKALAYDIEVKNADGVTIFYNYINDGKELEVTMCFYSGSVVIPEEVTYMGRTRKVTSIGMGAFNENEGLTSVTIPNSVTRIRDGAFDRCSGLTSVIIPNSVVFIMSHAFRDCSLTSITIPNSVVTIGSEAFQGCPLTSVVFGNSVTRIESGAFMRCPLTSITLPNSLTSIGNGAFNYIDLQEVISKIENPFTIPTNTFSDNTFYNVTLYVPKGTIDKYKATDGWKKFLFIEEGDGSGKTPEAQKCEKPTISYQNGKLTFHSATEGAVCHSTITDADIKSYSTNEVQLGVTYNITVYATKTGYENSETATATLCWIDVAPKTEGISNGVSTVRAMPVMIQSQGGVLNITGAPEGSVINVYDLSGKMVDSAISSSETTSIPTNLKSGEIGIVKIGDKSIKVVMQ